MLGFSNIFGPNDITGTAPAGDSTNRVADTAFVTNAIAVGTTGFVLQTIYNETTSLIASNLARAGNNTSVPIKTDGLQILSATITPASTSNNLLIRAVAPVCNSAAVNMITALFQDTTTSALAATVTAGSGNFVSNAVLVYEMVAATTGPTTFKINVTNFTNVASTWTVNGFSNPPTQALGGSLRATLVIQEIRG